MKINFSDKRGFTLFEVLLYISLAAFLLLGASIMLSLFLRDRVKNDVIADVEQEGAIAVQTMTQAMRNASGVNYPAASLSADSLSLAMTNAALNPTIFDVSGGALRIGQGNSAPIALTSPQVMISNLTFNNLSVSGAKGSVEVTFTMAYINPRAANEYNYSQIFRGAVTLR